ncbi:MAG: hypothetical protein ACI4TK_01420 [Agathobacter sp.]
MGYKLVVSEYADELLNNLLHYLIYCLKNEQAAKHLLEGVDSIFDIGVEVVNVVGVFHQLENYQNKIL